MRSFIFLLALVSASAAAQYSPSAQQVLALAPQLEDFAGSRGNFESLASGLRGATAVRLVTITPEGMREIVTFTAAQALSAAQTADVLEQARVRLLARTIPEPSGLDIALVLMGSTDPGLLAAADPDKPMVLALQPFAGSAANYRRLMRGLVEGGRITLVDPRDRRWRASFEPQCAMSQAEAEEVLLAAAERLGAQGIDTPTVRELRAALIEALAVSAGCLP